MKYNRLVHPEVIRGTRGTEELQDFYRDIIQGIKFPAKDPTAIGFPTRYLPLSQDPIAVLHFVLCKRYLENRGKCYYIPKDFLLALSTIDKAVPIEYLPENFIGYFQFADDVLSDDSGSVEGGYVYIGRIGDLRINVESLRPDERAIVICYLNKRDSPTNFWGLTKMIQKVERKKPSDMLLSQPSRDYDENLQRIDMPVEITLVRAKVYIALINALIYLQSDSPEIRSLRPAKDLTRAQREESRKACPIENQCTVPLTVLNWEYQGGRQYHVDGAFVKTHPRWQHYGPQNSRIKLIYVKEHMRHFKQGEGDVRQCSAMSGDGENSLTT